MHRKFTIEPLSSSHDRRFFTCGNNFFDTFLHQSARQAQDKDLSKTFVLVETGDVKVLGYYTLSIREVEIEDLPPELVKKLPRHPVPVVHLAMLGVHKDYQRQKLGYTLVIDALKRALAIVDNVGVHAVDVEAYEESLTKWYKKNFGFIEISDAERYLFLPMREVRKWFAQSASTPPVP